MSEYTSNLNLFKYDPINDSKEPFDIEKCLNENWDKIDEKVAGMPVGTIFAHTCSASFIPENSLPCDGTEYTQAQFPILYTNWLVSGNLETCTYEEYQEEVTSTGECLKWALDTTNQKFKVPTKINKILAINKNIPVKGNGMSLGLTDGNNKFAALTRAPYGSNSLEGTTRAYGQLLPLTGTQNTFSPSAAIGLTTDSSKSGIETDITNTTFKSIRFFVVVATGAINQSEMDWSQWASSLQGKADVDMSNLLDAGKIEITNLIIPDYEAGVSVSSSGFTSPCNCLFIVQGSCAGSAANAGVQIDDIIIYFNQENGYASSNRSVAISLFVAKNSTVSFVNLNNLLSATYYPLKGVN